MTFKKREVNYYSGLRFGRIVVGDIHHRQGGKIYVSCVCDCGNDKVINIGNLKRGLTMSCGCLNNELLSKRLKGRTGKRHHCWKGGRYIASNGYVNVYSHEQRGAGGGKYLYEHTIIAESVLGRMLPNCAVVHHVDGDKSNNERSNLVICENSAYHSLIHKRQRAKWECGNAGWSKCYVCGEWDTPINLYMGKSEIAHRECKAKRLREWRARAK